MDTRPPEDVVKERAQARWDAMVKSDFKTAYGYLSPGSRSTVTADGWAATLRSGYWKSAVVEKAVCDGPERCEAHVSVEANTRGGTFRIPFREPWIKVSGVWWFLYK